MMFEQFGKLIEVRPLYMFKDKQKPENETWILVFDKTSLIFDEAHHRQSGLTQGGYVTIHYQGSTISWFEHHNSVLVFEKAVDPYQQCLDDLQQFLDNYAAAWINAPVAITAIQRQFIDKKRS